MNISFNPLVRVRTVTAFVNLSADKAQWQAGLTQAKQQCDAVADAISWYQGAAWAYHHAGLKVDEKVANGHADPVGGG